MAITNYDQLKAAVANWIDRTDLTTEIVDFVALAEGQMNRDLEVRNRNIRSTATISTEYFDLPSDYVSMRNIQIDGSPTKILKYHTPAQLDEMHASQSSGTPLHYTIHGTELQFKPVPDSSITVQISYTAERTNLSNGNDTNWVLTHHPDVYLYGTLIHVGAFIKKNTQVWDQLYIDAVRKLNRQAKKGQHSGAPLVIKSTTGTP